MAACRTADALQQRVGDGVMRAAEACDDGNTDDGDGCSLACTIERGFGCTLPGPGGCAPLRGDGPTLGDKERDDSDFVDSDGCSFACRLEPGCACGGPCARRCAATAC